MTQEPIRFWTLTWPGLTKTPITHHSTCTHIIYLYLCFKRFFSLARGEWCLPLLGWEQKWGVGLKPCDDDCCLPHVPFLELTVQISQETTADAIARKLRPYGAPGLVLTR